MFLFIAIRRSGEIEVEEAEEEEDLLEVGTRGYRDIRVLVSF